MKKPKVIIEKKNRGHFWTLIAGNGAKVAYGGEPFVSNHSALRSVKRMMDMVRRHKDIEIISN